MRDTARFAFRMLCMQVALFPLKTVLFPGGVLPLRVFEARYMDMVRDCMRNEQPFGVVLITQGGEVGEVPRFEPVGCLADIDSWDMQQLGLLHIRTIGRQRFRVRSQSASNGIVTAEVELIAPDDEAPIAKEYKPCVDLLRRIIDDLQHQAEQQSDSRAEGAESSEGPPRSPFERPYRLDSAVWVGNRLCEVLPVPLKAKQKLMELEDASARLSIVNQYLKQHAIL